MTNKTHALITEWDSAIERNEKLSIAYDEVADKLGAIGDNKHYAFFRLLASDYRRYAQHGREIVAQINDSEGNYPR